MALFLILASPLWLMLVVSLYRTPSRGWRAVIAPLMGGMLIGVATITFTLLLLTRVPFGMQFSQLYTWAWMRGPGWPLTVVTPVTAVLYLRRPTSYSRIREICAWLCGAAIVYMLWTALSPEPGSGLYRMFISPFVWLSAMGTVSCLLDRGLRMNRGFRYAVLFAAVAAPSLVTFIPVMAALGNGIPAVAAAAAVAGGTTVLIFLDSRGRWT